MPTVHFKVGMTCGGCEGAVKCVCTILFQHLAHTPQHHSRALSLSSLYPFTPPAPHRRILTKLAGVTDVATHVEAKSVAVTLAEDAATSMEALLEALEKWGKAAGKDVALAEGA